MDELRMYHCKSIDSKIKIDGNTKKQEWMLADEVLLMDTITGNPSVLKTTAKLLWNSEYLYIAFECQDDYIYATKTNYNDALYEEDVVEVFIDDDSDLKTYIEIEVNPLNTVFHYCIHNNLKDELVGYSRNQKMIMSEVKKEEGGYNWSVEIAIPFKEFVTAKNSPPQIGDIWKVNLFRIDHKRDGEVDYFAWSPTGKARFHLPEKFGELVFV